ncbi:MAG: DUF1593 domain-containing protein [Bacteroidales bacterium]|nr:DUF1593 domain-containing protein [Bacteroidales bacterium]
MKIKSISACMVFMIVILLFSCSEQKQVIETKETPKSRVIVLTDMLNEADDSQTMVRLLMYANKFDIEGLIAVSSCHQYKGRNDTIPARNDVHPEEIVKFIDAYEDVRENLSLHEDGWPTAGYLLERVGQGPSGFGMSDVGEGKSTTGSQLIVNALLSDDPRPLYICINAGANCLAQALFDLRASYDQQRFRQLTEKLRVYDDAGQDDAGAWIAYNFPEIHYQRSQSQVFSFISNNGPVTWDSTMYPGMGQHIWARKNIQNDHGPLGELYPDRMKWKDPSTYSTLEGGGTSTWIGHVNHGLYVAEEMTWGGWGGRFDSVRKENITADQLKIWQMEGTEDPFKPFYMYGEAMDEWTDPITGKVYNEVGTAIYRWRRAYQNDFEARMDWCLKPYNEANHNPVSAFNGDKTDGIVFIEAKGGTKILLDATASSDPDGDSLQYRWYTYPEAGNIIVKSEITDALSPKATFTVPLDAPEGQIHIILEVSDQNEIIPLFDYRRIVLNITK